MGAHTAPDLTCLGAGPQEHRAGDEAGRDRNQEQHGKIEL